MGAAAKAIKHGYVRLVRAITPSGKDNPAIWRLLQTKIGGEGLRNTLSAWTLGHLNSEHALDGVASSRRSRCRKCLVGAADYARVQLCHAVTTESRPIVDHFEEELRHTG